MRPQRTGAARLLRQLAALASPPLVNHELARLLLCTPRTVSRWRTGAGPANSARSAWVRAFLTLAPDVQQAVIAAVARRPARAAARTSRRAA